MYMYRKVTITTLSHSWEVKDDHKSFSVATEAASEGRERDEPMEGGRQEEEETKESGKGRGRERKEKSPVLYGLC